MASTQENNVAEAIGELMQEAAMDDEEVAGRTFSSYSTFEDGGVLTMNAGITVRFEDGAEFQITVVQSKSGNKLPCPDCESFNTERFENEGVEQLKCNDCDAEFDMDEIDFDD